MGDSDGTAFGLQQAHVLLHAWVTTGNFVLVMF